MRDTSENELGDILIEIFPPSIIDSPNMDFLEFLTEEWEDEDALTIIPTKDLQEKFFKYYKSIWGKRRFDKDQLILKKAFNDCLKKLFKNKFLNLTNIAVGDIDVEGIGNFTVDLRYIKKSKDRLVRYTIFHLFLNGKKRITIKEIEKKLEKFKLKNLEKAISTIIKKCQEKNLKISFNEDTISLNYNKSEKLVGKIILTEIYSGTRKRSGRLRRDIVELLEYESLSGNDIADITDTDKGHVSKTINKLLDENLIVRADWSGNSRFYFTNCDNCPFGRAKEKCFEQTVKYIQTVCKEKFGITIHNKIFENTDNHILRNMEKVLKLSTRELSQKIEKQNYKFFGEIFNALRLSSINKKYKNWDEFLFNLPRSYVIGQQHGITEGIELQSSLVAKAFKGKLTPEEIEKGNQQYFKLYNKFLKTGKI